VQESIEQAVDKTVAEFGRVDIFVANAGIPWTKGPILEADNVR
jgi:sorbose reductase